MKKLTENDCIKAIREFINECDANELARLVGELFGGECFSAKDEETNILFYVFEQNEYYSGKFDDVKNV